MKARTKKGISPLVAVIMLIAFTLIVAGILAGWATQFAQTQRRAVEHCVNARVLLMKGVYDSPAQTLSLVLYNFGEVDLELTTLLSYANTSLHPDIIETYSSKLNVTSGSTKTYVLQNVSTDLTDVTVRSNRCPGTQDLLTSGDITGL
jgi:flagellin-like protein